MPNDFFIAGIDEAGRGAVCGPMVLAGVMCTKRQESLLRKMGVKDSKLLSPQKREKLAEAIENTVKDIVVINVGPCKIDSHRKSGLSLNQIEGMKMADIASFLKPHKVFIDSPDRNIPKFKVWLSKMIQHDPEIVLEHKADLNYPVVSAASIIAKVERDRQMAKLCEEHGEMGSGYPSDEVTMTWLRNWIAVNKRFPDFVRRSWLPADVMEKEKAQSRLSSWFRSRK
jgi:ribonuclease HII